MGSNTSPQDLLILAAPSKSNRKRKQSDQSEHPFSQHMNEPRKKRPRTSSAAGDSDTISIGHWIQDGRWPKEYFEQDSAMSQPFSRKRSSSSSQQNSDSSNTTFREGKNPATKDRLYEKILATAKIYMDNDGKARTTDDCITLCKTLLDAVQSTPKDSLFRDDLFEKTCYRLRNENEAMVSRDISPPIVPPAELLHAFGAEQLEHLMGHVNQNWYGYVPIVLGPAPQPDYAVGFKESAFSQDQLKKLEPFTSGWKRTPFLATAWMYFPFLTCEVKCGNEALNIADRQNAHSGSVAVKQILHLYREVSRESELHLKILAFSVSHDHNALRIYGHYPLIDGDQTFFYRHPIHKFDFTALDGRDKWTAWRFTRNVYDIFVPTHLERIRTAIDQLPDPDHQSSQQSVTESASQLELDESRSTPADSQETVPDGPSSQTSEPSFKKPKNKNPR